MGLSNYIIDGTGFDYKGALQEAIEHIEDLLLITPPDDEISKGAREFLRDGLNVPSELIEVKDKE